ncbi:MAG: ABC transporter ATP-binding protein [Clostridiales bacterium]|nr:ABC transporter ATP-binding protein [Clostridiales bacterium]
MIEVRNVTKKYTGFTALEDVSLTVGESSIYGLVGHNGAGKTTLLKTAAGIFKADKGKILANGENVYDNEELRKSMFFVPDEIYFLPQANILNMEKFYKGFFPEWDSRIRKELTGLFKLDEKRHIARFSKGMQRQTAILLALSSKPKYLLLDEIFDGLDPVIRKVVKELMLEIISETKASVIISTHNIKELENLCDHIGILNNKNLVYDNSTDEMGNEKFKCRIVFNHEPEIEHFKSINHRALKIVGKVASFTIDESSKDIDKKLALLNPVLIEKIPMSLEEVLLEEMEVTEYDFSGIFK